MKYTYLILTNGIEFGSISQTIEARDRNLTYVVMKNKTYLGEKSAEFREKRKIVKN